MTFEDPTVTSPEERQRLFRQHDHVRIYGADYPDRLADAGFSVDVNYFADSLDKGEQARLALLREAPVFVARKIDAS